MDVNNAVITTLHDQKQGAKNGRSINAGGIAAAAIGVVVMLMGFSWIGSLGPYASDADSLMALILTCAGIALIIGGIAVPLMAGMAFKAEENSKIVVYEDHIEGSCGRVSNGQTMIADFHEAYSNIGSVSSTDRVVIVNMKDGTCLRCAADNAAEVAQAIRARIPQ